jgi:hypothetical protein
VAVVAPAATRTEEGTVNAEVRELASVTDVPPVGADLEMVTVQVVAAEAASEVLPHCREDTVMGTGAVIEKATEAVDVPREAVTVAF